MAERRAHFERRFRNVWSTGPTGVSFVQLTVEDPFKAEDLISELFHKTLVADVEQYKQKVQRTFVENGHEAVYGDVNKIIMVTGDDRVAELIEEVAAKNPNTRKYPAFDLVVTPIVTGSKEYIEWVKLQTQKKDADAAFFNIQAKEAMHGLDNRVGKIAEVADVKPGEVKDVLTQEEDQDADDDEEDEDQS